MQTKELETFASLWNETIFIFLRDISKKTAFQHSGCIRAKAALPLLKDMILHYAALVLLQLFSLTSLRKSLITI